jgi:hypothetical protein
LTPITHQIQYSYLFYIYVIFSAVAYIIALTICKYKYIFFYSHKRVVSPLLDTCTFSNLLLVTLLPVPINDRSEVQRYLCIFLLFR